MVLKYKDGDLMNEKKIVLNEAQKMLVEKNLSIVQIVINKFMRNIQGDNITPDYSKEDAIQDGYLALCKAAFTFDYGKIFRLKDMQLLLYIIMFILRCRSISKRKKVL